MKALSIRQPWAWLITAGHKDIENRTWYTRFRGKFLIHASKHIDRLAYTELRLHPKFGPLLPDKLETGGIVGYTTIKDCVDMSTSPWFFGPRGFVLENSGTLPFIPLSGRLGFFKPLGDYSVRDCRGHWHVTVGEEEDDLMLDGDPYRSMHDALVSALKHKHDMEQDRADFRKSQIISARTTRKSIESYRK